MHLKGGADFHCMVSHGGHPCMAGNLCMEPPCMIVCNIETQQTDVNWCKTYGREAEGHTIYANTFIWKVGQNPNVKFLVGDSHAWADTSAWNPHVKLSPLSKSNEQAATHTKQMINNAKGMPLPIKMHVKGGPDFQNVATYGGQPSMDGQKCIKPPCMAVCPIETQ